MIDLPVSSCHGLLQALQKSGYVFALEVRRRYYPTRRLFEVGAALAAHDPIVDRLPGNGKSARRLTRPFCSASGRTITLFIFTCWKALR